MADLSSLMRIAPGTAGFFTGQQFADSRQREQIEQQKLAQTLADLKAAAEQKQVMNPLLVQQQQIMNQKGQAELPGIVADSSLKGVNAEIAAGTKDSRIDYTNKSNQIKLDDEKAKLFGERSKQLMTYAPMLEAVPTALGQRTQAAIQMFQEIGMDPNSPQAQALLQNPDALPANLAKISRRMAEQSASYIQSMDTAKLNRDSAEREGAANRANQVKLEEMRLEARKAAADARKGAGDFWTSFYKLKSARDKHAALIAEAAKIANEAPEEAKRMRAIADEIRPQAEAEINSVKPGTPDINALTKGQVPVNAGPNIAPRGAPTTPSAAPKATLADVQKMYPGVPADRLKQAYKNKFGVDLQ